ncbi:MAG: penicillin-binding transpeptidase domain-containing protein [Coprobacillus sp.]
MYDVYTNNNRNKKKLIIGGIVGVVIVAVIAMFFLLSGNSHKKVLNQYFGYIQDKKYDEMYDLISVDSQERYKKDEFIERNKNIYEGIEASDIQLIIKDEKKEDDKDIIEYTIKMKTVAGNLEYDNQATFEDNKIEWSDSFIHPHLKQGYKVRISTTLPTRGRILDRNGVVLAGEGEAYSVGLVQQKLNGENDYEKIGSLLGMTKDDVKNKMSAKWIKPDSFVPLKTISKEDEKTSNALLAISGVKLSTTKIRSYPFKKSTSHMLGYMQKVTAEDLEKHKNEGYTETSYIGKSGIEAAYEKDLKGSLGAKIYIVDEKNLEVSPLVNKEKEDGKDIQLTIDATLQKDLYNSFEKDKSASVALNPKTGEVLALVSTPTFSSEDFIFGYTSSQWKTLNDDKAQPLYNRFKASWTPGSTMKPITAAIGLESGKLDSSEDYNAEMKWQKDSSWGSYFVTTLHAPQPNNLKNAIIASDNVYFAKAATKIGKDALEKGYKNLKLGESIPFELSLNKSQYTSKDFSDAIQIADSGYGQGEILMNPIHMASLYGGFVNGGTVMTPHLVKGTKSSAWVEKACSKENANEIKEDLISVVKEGNGTAHSLYDANMTIGGKTGTAEIKASQTDTTGTELGWFAVMNADQNSNKQIVIVTMVEDVKGRGGSGYVVDHTKAPLYNYIKK